jgi:isopenicillin-N epimerase
LNPNSSPLSNDLFLLDPEITYLNHGSFGATLRSVFEKYQWWQRELEREPVEFLGRRFNDLMREARASLAAYVHANPDEIVYVPNATTGLNIVARSLPLKPGDEILATDHEYGALDRTWRFLCRKSGAVYKTQPIPVPLSATQDFVETFWHGVTPRTRVVFISHITSSTSLIFPIKEICRRAREAGIISIIDGAHALGQIPLDLQDLGADFYASNAHKWLCAPKGSAFLYARREMQKQVEPLVVSWGYESVRPSESCFVDEQEWTGTNDFSAYLSVPEAIGFYKEHNWEQVRAQCHELVRYARDQIAGTNTPNPHLCLDSPDWFMQMATIPLPDSVRVEPDGSSKLQARLMSEFKIEVPVLAWQGKPYVRVSIQAYNSQEDIDRLVDALGKTL